MGVGGDAEVLKAAGLVEYRRLAEAMGQTFLDRKPNEKRRWGRRVWRSIEYLKTVRDLMIRLDRESEFQAWVAQLEKAYKEKRNFVTLLRKQDW